MNNDIWKETAAVLAGMITTGVAAWLVFGQDKVTRTDMVDYVDAHAPWTRDRGGIESAIRESRSDIDKLNAAVDRLVATQQELVVEQRVLVTKLQAFLDGKDGR